jgi:hypothetical protein
MHSANHKQQAPDQDRPEAPVFIIGIVGKKKNGEAKCGDGKFDNIVRRQKDVFAEGIKMNDFKGYGEEHEENGGQKQDQERQ